MKPGKRAMDLKTTKHLTIQNVFACFLIPVIYLKTGILFASDNFQNDRRSVFDFNVITHLVCKATAEGKEKEGLKNLLGAGLKLDNVYFDIICPGNYSLLLTSLVSDNFQGANYYLRYLRWRERETGKKSLRIRILNEPNQNGETLVDVTRFFLKQSKDVAETIRLQSFLKLFKKHGGECKKYCEN